MAGGFLSHWRTVPASLTFTYAAALGGFGPTKVATKTFVRTDGGLRSCARGAGVPVPAGRAGRRLRSVPTSHPYQTVRSSAPRRTEPHAPDPRLPVAPGQGTIPRSHPSPRTQLTRSAPRSFRGSPGSAPCPPTEAPLEQPPVLCALFTSHPSPGPVSGAARPFHPWGVAATCSLLARVHRRHWWLRAWDLISEDACPGLREHVLASSVCVESTVPSAFLSLWVRAPSWPAVHATAGRPSVCTCHF